MKKGFTLIELLAVLALLGIIILVAIPSLVNSNQKQKQNEKDRFNEIINDACETYVSVEKINDNTIQVSTLIEKGYLSGDLVNPNTGKKISTEYKSVNITQTNPIECQYEGVEI